MIWDIYEENFDAFNYITKENEYLESINEPKNDDDDNEISQKFLKNDPLIGSAAVQSNTNKAFLQTNENASRDFENGVQLSYNQYQQLSVMTPSFATGYYLNIG